MFGIRKREKQGSLLHSLDCCFETEMNENQKSDFELQKHVIFLCASLFCLNLYLKLYLLTSIFNRQADL
jgi:hypothetical protein